MTKWIEVGEHLPPEGEDVVVAQNTDGVIDVLFNVFGWKSPFENHRIIRWMLLRASCGADHPVPVELEEARE